MRLLRSIYGMKQASRVWNITFDTAVREWGFTHLPCEWCVYRRQSVTGTIIFAVHFDDIISIASSLDENKHFQSLLTSRWDISALGPAKFALGIALSRDRSAQTISLSQAAMIDRLLERFDLLDARPADTPMAAGLCLDRPDKMAPVDPVITRLSGGRSGPRPPPFCPALTLALRAGPPCSWPWPLKGQHWLALARPGAGPGPTRPHPLKKLFS
jgi:Reverse transcriptase (RNA-dependent DNA polymerase)